MADFQPATRTTSHNARGHNRRIGHSKRSSVYDDTLGELPKLKKKALTETERDVQYVDSCIPTLTGASSFFRNQRIGSKGIRGKIKDATDNGELLQISQLQFSSFLEIAGVHDPNRVFIDKLWSEKVGEISHLSWMLQTGHNILLYGIGDKGKICDELVRSCLSGEDVIEFNSSQSNSSREGPSIKGLLAFVESVILKNKLISSSAATLEGRAQLVAELLDIHYGRGIRVDALSSLPLSPNAPLTVVVPPRSRNNRVARQRVDDSTRWGGRYAQAQSRLYLIVDDISGENMNDPVTQRCLAVLAQCRSIALVAILGSLNSVALWDNNLLAQYEWAYVHWPTFERTVIPPSSFPLVVAQDCATYITPMEEDGNLDIQEAVQRNEINAVNNAADSSGVLGDERLGLQLSQSSSATITNFKKKSKREGEAADALVSSAASTSSANAGGGSAKLTSITITASTAASARAAHGLTAINHSLTPKHKEMLTVLIDALRTKLRQALDKAEQLSTTSTKEKVNTRTSRSNPCTARADMLKKIMRDRLNQCNGIPINDLFERLRSTLVVKTPKDLTHLMKEYKDHGVINTVMIRNTELVCLNPPYDFFKTVDSNGVPIV